MYFSVSIVIKDEMSTSATDDFNNIYIHVAMLFAQIQYVIFIINFAFMYIYMYIIIKYDNT